MKLINKIIIGIFFLLLFLIALTNINEFSNNIKKYISEYRERENKVISESKESLYYSVYKYEKLDSVFDNYDEALLYAKSFIKSYVTEENKKVWLWDSFDQYIVFSENVYIKDYSNFDDAYTNAKILKYGTIYYENTNNPIWSRTDTLSQKILLDVALINQYPELPRGCEVTSLSMLLNSQNINIDKMDLAKEVSKSNQKYKGVEGSKVIGNPNEGFVGDMYNLKKYGYGVYHEPINELFQKYSGNNTIDMSGYKFEDLLVFINKGAPVWIITNTTFKELEEKNYKLVNINGEDIIITPKEHSVIITGYDDKNVYINDPLKKQKNIKVNKNDFKEAWEQMGSQAITYIKITK